MRQYGYDQVLIKVDALSSTANNARQIRDAVLAMPAEPGPARLVLIGYSKGAPDILDALVTYPEIRNRVAAVVSAAGAVGGSPLANDAEQYQADMLRHFPGAICESGDGSCGREPAACGTQSVARRESIADGRALLLAGHVPAAGAHFLGAEIELSQARPHRCTQR